MGLKGDIFVDEFEHRKMADGWEWVDRRQDCSHKITRRGRLEITCPAGHDLWPSLNFNAPRLIRPVADDFIIETKIRVKPKILFEGAGLIIWKNLDNFVRYERGHRGEGDYPLGEGPEVCCSKEEDGTFLDLFREECKLTTLLMRIVKEGRKVSMQYGETGTTWHKMGDTTFDVAGPLRAGVHVICSRYPHNTPGSLTATFDYVKIET
jgi:regulation of enolase protein 1 (concanavalin A-like superfamily)